MKKIFVSVMAFVFVGEAFAQGSDPVLMTVNGKDITRSEFEYSFNKNNSDGVIDKKSLEEYVPLYEAFRLKVAAAEDAGIDTLEYVRKDLAGYKQQVVYPTIKDTAYLEQIARETYDNTAKRYQGEDILRASHILILVKQDATEAEKTAAKTRIDSIYNALVSGADFAELATKCSQDQGSARRGGDLGQFGKGMMVPEFETAAYTLQKGELSQPVKSAYGWHVIKMVDRHPFEPYEFHREKILAFLEQRGVQSAVAKHYIDSIAKQRGLTEDEVVESMFNDLISNDEDLRLLSKEYHDGTLMYEMVKATVWDKAAADEEGLTQYFKKNKKQYAWDAPRFKGMVIYAKDDTYLKQAKAIAKKYKEALPGAQAIVKELNNDSVKFVRIEHGIYQKGDNQNVDALAFGEKKDLKPKADLTSVGINGKVIKAPQSYTDVKAQIQADYQKAKEDEWVAELRQKYVIKVNEDVLKTVNNHE